MAPGRTDLVAGLVLLGCLYGVERLVRRLPATRLERYVLASGRAGHGLRVGSAAVIRAALADDLPDRAVIRRG